MDLFECLKAGTWVYAAAKDSPEVTKALESCAEKCFELNSLSPSKTEERGALVKRLLGSVGNGFVLHSPFRCDFGFNIHVGENFVGNFNLAILDEAEVHIGNNVMIGPNCSLITITHALDAGQRADGVMRAKPIVLGDDVWLAAGVTVLPGVTIGKGSVIGAGSVVAKSIPAGVLAMGSPCRPIRPITDDDRVDI